ncbi:MAG: GerMN domain-containing protein [Lachnospiraceae bacterium]|nr:GerMN domain-containing protein [Lachnospiraceae bacterium]
MSRLKRVIVICMVVMLGIMPMAGCANADSEDSNHTGYVVYTANSNGTGLDSERYEIREKEANDVVNRLYKLVSRSTDRGVSGIYAQLSRRPDFTISDRVLYVDLPESYNNMNNVDQILLRASIVKTMIQVDEIDYVSFSIDNKPLTMYVGMGNDVNTSAGSALINGNNFVDSELNAYDMLERKELVLYYADADGTGLVGEREYVSYNKNTSVEQVIVEKLIEGPDISAGQRALPNGIKLLSISTREGVCYVNLSETFLDTMSDVSAEATLYSIVNSLCEVDGIKKVQILVNGNKTDNFREKYPLSNLYERNLDLVSAVYIN